MRCVKNSTFWRGRIVITAGFPGRFIGIIFTSIVRAIITELYQLGKEEIYPASQVIILIILSNIKKENGSRLFKLI
jgi:hypothetical protein